MRIRSVKHNNRKRAFEIKVSTRTFLFPYSKTDPRQLYRLLDQTNSRKSVDQMLALLQVLDCDVDFVVRPKAASRRAAA